MRVAAAVATAIVLACAAAARADVIVLTDGTRVRAKLLDVDAAHVMFRTPDGAETMRPRADVAGVLFFDAAAYALPPRQRATDRLEMDGEPLDGALLRFVRGPLGPYGLTKVAFVDSGGALRCLATSRRIAALSFGTDKPADPAASLAAAEKALAAATAKDDAAALVFGAESALAAQTSKSAKERLAAAIESARGLGLEHEKTRLALGDVRGETWSLLGAEPQVPQSRGVRVTAHLLSSDGELFGATLRFYWRTKSGREGWWERAYFTRTPAADHVASLAFGREDDEIVRVAVQLRDGDRVVATKEALPAPVPSTDPRWWRDVKAVLSAADFVVDDGVWRPGDKTVWSRTPAERDVEEPDAERAVGPFAK